MRRALLLTALFACSKTAAPAPPDGGTGLQIRSCESVLTYAPPASAIQVYVAGDWNGFSATASQMRPENGAYALHVTLPAGEHAYKLVVDGQWQLDPGNPWTQYLGGTLNSSLRVDDCHAPLLQLVSFDHGDATLRIVDGVQSPGIDASGFTALLDGAPLALSEFDPDGTVKLHAGAVAAGKHVITARFTNRAGVPARELTLPWWTDDFQWRDGLLYFAMVDRFANGDPSNDAPAPGIDPRLNYEGGDFAGLRQKIEAGYFDQLGVSVIWVSNPMKQTVGGWPGDYGPVTGYHGYWPTSDVDTEPRWGTLDEFKAMVDAAHKRGIRILIDFVANHVHQDHPWFSAHPSWFNPLHIQGGDCTCGGSAVCSYDTTPLVCWFAPYLPDLDYTNFDAARAIEDTAVRWMKSTNADGLRVDAVKHFQHIVGTRIRARLHEELELTGVPVYMVGETFAGADDASKQLIKQYVSPQELSGQFDFPFYWQVQGSFVDLAATLAQEAAGYYGAGALMSPFIDNHDRPRFISVAAGSSMDPWNNPPPQPTDPAPYGTMKVALTILLGVPGLPLLWQGDEIALAGAGDPDNRRFMQFDTALLPLQSDMLAYVRKLGTLRKADAVLRRGDYRTLSAAQDTLVFSRHVAGTPARIVAVNRGAATTIDVTMPVDLDLQNGAQLDDALGGSSVVLTSGHLSVSLPQGGAAIYLPH